MPPIPPGTVTLASPTARMEVSALAHRLLVALLAYQKTLVFPRRTYEPEKSDALLITYKALCLRAGAGNWRKLGTPLYEVGDWCTRNKWPPINALAVTGKGRRPGYGYPEGEYGDWASWERDVYATLLFKYPARAARTLP